MIRAALAAVAASLVCAPAATAHIVVSPARATAGATIRLVFEAPNERDDAQIVSVRVVVPEAFRLSRAEAPPQWRAVRRGSTVDWSGALIAANATQRFALVGRIERTARFHAFERFSDGEVATYETEVVVPGAGSSRAGLLLVAVAAAGAVLTAFGAGLAFWLRRSSTLQDS